VKILIKFPTRNRKEKFFDVLQKYYDYATDKKNLEFLITLDSDDLSMNNDEVKLKLNEFNNLRYIFGKSENKIHAVNRDIDINNSNWDIILLASDDMIPIQLGYDELIRNKMKEFYSDTDGVLWFNDGFQGNKLNTLCILGKKYYQRFNYIYYPNYKSTWSDNEFMDVANILNKQKYFNDIIIKHEHPDWGYGNRDEIHKLNSNNVNWDSQLYHKRKINNFGL
jgi:hypothetical protein